MSYPILLGNSEKVALIDKEFYSLALLYNWNLEWHGYVRTSIGYHPRKAIFLHVLIGEMVGLKGKIDHIDRDKLNCQKDNLREASRSQNHANRTVQGNNFLGVKGVRLGQSNRFQARCQKHHLGSFRTLKEASDAYDRAAIAIYGDFACLNNYKE